MQHWSKILGYNVVCFAAWILVEYEEMTHNFLFSRKPVLQDDRW